MVIIIPVEPQRVCARWSAPVLHASPTTMHGHGHRYRPSAPLFGAFIVSAAVYLRFSSAFVTSFQHAKSGGVRRCCRPIPTVAGSGKLPTARRPAACNLGSSWSHRTRARYSATTSSSETVGEKQLVAPENDAGLGSDMVGFPLQYDGYLVFMIRRFKRQSAYRPDCLLYILLFACAGSAACCIGRDGVVWTLAGRCARQRSYEGDRAQLRISLTIETLWLMRLGS